jgi:hypothetical protein
VIIHIVKKTTEQDISAETILISRGNAKEQELSQKVPAVSEMATQWATA